MKDDSRLFKDVSEEVYEDVFDRLQQLRQLHPSYRDDQLLMFMLCQGYSGIYKQHEPRRLPHRP